MAADNAQGPNGPNAFLNAENFKRVLDAAAADLAREHSFSFFGAAPSAVLRSMATDAMRGAWQAPDPFRSAVAALVSTCKSRFHLDRASVMADFERVTKDRTAPPATNRSLGPNGVGTQLASESPPPPISEAELRDRLRERERVIDRVGDEDESVNPEPFRTFGGKAFSGGASGHAPGSRGHGEKHGDRHAGAGAGAGAGAERAYMDKLHHVVVSSMDRDWAGAHPLRYQYQVQLDGTGGGASLNVRLRNIVSVEIDYLIVPTEIVLNRQDTSTDALAYRYRNLYENSYSFNYPYMIVQAEELQNFYYGTNDVIRQAFAVLTHSSSFDDVNGRNYEVLRPVATAKHEFRPPLAGLTSLSLAFRMPNGALLNNSRDGAAVLGLTWSNVRPAMVKVVTRFFDRNEFYVGDYVQFAGFVAPAGAPTSAAKLVADFVGRPSGHQVYDMGDVNPDSYYNSFYVRAPGAFDDVVGAYVADPAFLAAILLVQPRSTRPKRPESRPQPSSRCARR